ncbi:MAG: DMT family transporter [Spirochaetaceae bacterium]
MNIILALITGLCISVMIYFNGSLESYIGNIPSLLLIHLTALFLSSVMFLKKSKPKVRIKKSRLYLLAGIIGILVVTISNQVFRKGGVLLTLSGTLSGQVIMAFILEVVKSKKTDKKISIGKVISLLLVLPGSIILGSQNSMSLGWILLSWVPGFLILIQAYMNSQNILSVGFRVTLIFHFATALVGILLLLTIFPLGDTVSQLLSGQVPPIFIFGGGFVSIFVISIGSYLLLKLTPLTYVLLLYTGQLTGALIIDLFQGRPLSVEIVFAMCLIVIGLFSGEFKKSTK